MSLQERQRLASDLGDHMVMILQNHGTLMVGGSVTEAFSSKLNKEPVEEYLKSNVVLMKNMIANGYADARTLSRRIEKVEA